MRTRNNVLVRYKDYVAGWLDSTIHEFVGYLPRASKMAFALITSLDSDLAPASLVGKSPELSSFAHDAKPVGTGILLPTAQLFKADAENQVFHGFDEVWFFPDDQIEPKPESAWLVGPRRIEQSKLEILGPWMAKNGCSLALGDGDGLNLIVKARGLVRYLVAYSKFQPQPRNIGDEHSEELLPSDSGS